MVKSSIYSRSYEDYITKILFPNIHLSSKKTRTPHKVRKLEHFHDHFTDLTPKIDTIKSIKYIKSIKWALENINVNNIALTGPYGSGKSSILKAFVDKYPQYECLNISLALFKDTDIKNKVDEIEKSSKKNHSKTKSAISESSEEKLELGKSAEEFHKLIEFSILQQMLYKKPANKFPLSRFKRIENPKRYIRIIMPMLILIWLCSVLFSSFPTSSKISINGKTCPMIWKLFSI